MEWVYHTKARNSSHLEVPRMTKIPCAWEAHMQSNDRRIPKGKLISHNGIQQREMLHQWLPTLAGLPQDTTVIDKIKQYASVYDQL